MARTVKKTDYHDPAKKTCVFFSRFAEQILL